MNKRYWAFLGFPDFYGVRPCRRMAGSWLLFGARLSRVPKTGHKGFLIPHCRCLQSNSAPLWMIVPPFIIIIIIITNTGSGGFHCAQTLDWTGSFASLFSHLHSPVSSEHSVLLFWSFGNTLGCSLILNSIIWIPFQQQSFPHFSSFTIQSWSSSSTAASMFIISIIGWPNSLRFL